MNINYRVNLGFAGYSDSDLYEFTSGAISSLTGNPAFPATPITITDLTALQTTFGNAVTAAGQGGVQLTAIKNAARIALLTALRRIAAYVQSVASQDVVILLSSGFQANSTNRAQTALDVPTIISITNDATTTLTVRLQPVNNARAYQLRYNVNGGAWQPIVDSTAARRILLNNLTPGTTYITQSRAVGGATGYSGWSDPISHMAT